MNLVRPGSFRFAVLFAAFLLMPILSTTRVARSAPQLKLTRSPSVLSALKILDGASAAITAEQIRITEIPAPTFSEAARGAYLGKLLSECGLKVTTDDMAT